MYKIDEQQVNMYKIGEQQVNPDCEQQVARRLGND